ncbi:ATP-dependent helicase [Rhodococcus rhodnii]|nr:ATP-dependent DNA helicase [Rhodococcus rhodnii]TXG90615.1 ATP-dependent helicase [Rhodococcus rhodnii]
MGAMIDAAPTRARVGLRARRASARAVREWPAAVRPVLDGPAPSGGPWQVLGGPGTGKTSLVIDAAVARIASGVDPESVLVLTGSRRSAQFVRGEITAALHASGTAHGDVRAAAVTREPLVRTLHSYAFAVLRVQASRDGMPPPRLLTGAEQDAVVREMLRGELEDGAQQWPPSLRSALGLAGFAAQVRELMLRCAERGLGPEDLDRLAHEHDRPEWAAVARFAVRYEQTMLLRAAVGAAAPEATAPALDAAELVSAAVGALLGDPGLLRAERARIRHVLVDDAQHLDPQAAHLVGLLTSAAESSVVTGDPDQAVFGFRGADPSHLVAIADRGDTDRVVLRTGYRCAPEIAGVAHALVRRLPGASEHRGWAPSESEPDASEPGAGGVSVRVFASQAKEAAAVADLLRRAHIHDGIAWSDMAVVVRSVPAVSPPLRRALLTAGVPMVTPAAETSLARRRGVAALLGVLRIVGGTDFTADDALALLSGPIGGADPVSLRRLRRGVRRAELAADRAGADGERDSAELLRLLVLGHDLPEISRALTDVERRPLDRVLSVVARARTAAERGDGVEDVLWAAWQATGLERRWAATAARGGSLGAQADRDLDGIVALFDAAAGYVDRLPGARIAGFTAYLEGQELATAPRGTRAEPDAVTLLSAHAAAGREWDVVAVCGVQEGSWPSVRASASVLRTELLVDLWDGVPAGATVSRTAPQVVDERRLLLVACSRARRGLLVSGVDSTGGDADLVRSRFVDELATDIGAVTDEPLAPEPGPRRVLALPSLVAELRSVVCDPGATEERRDRAARHLARLAREGVRGAHPDEWYGLAALSTDAPLWQPDDGPVPLSPSTIELLSNCPLRWMLERHGGATPDDPRAVTGTLVHTLVQALAGNIPPDRVEHELAEAWTGIDFGSPWFSRRELERTRTMLETFAEWLRRTRTELTEVGVEVEVDAVVPPDDPDAPSIRIRGRVDRLEQDAQGRPVVIDVKTAKTPVSKAAAAEHAQLAAYQLAAALGAIDGVPAGDPGGARLVFVAKPSAKEGATQRLQPPLGPEGLDHWLDVVREAAEATRGPEFTARLGDGCRHCPVRSSCPVHDEGRQVGGEVG